MSALAAGLVLAVLSSVALNASYLLQHAGSHDAPALGLRQPLVAVRALLRSGRWLAGSLLGLAGWGLAVAALAFAPLSLVQTFGAGGLVLTVPLAARHLRQRLHRGELLALGGLVLALVVLALGAPAQDPRRLPAAALALALVLAAGLAAAALAAAPRLRPGVGAGAAGGILYGAGDAAIKAVTVEVHERGVTGLVSPWTLAVAALSVVAFAAFQRGLQAGDAVPVIAVMTGATSTVAIVTGLLALREPLGSPGPLGVVALAVAVACAVRLAGAQEASARP